MNFVFTFREIYTFQNRKIEAYSFRSIHSIHSIHVIKGNLLSVHLVILRRSVLYNNLQDAIFTKQKWKIILNQRCLK